MGKGKRNRQLHVEDKQTNPAKAKDRAKKQQFIMPKWAKMTICFVLLAVILIGAVAISLLNGGIVYRTRILVESNSGKYDINQQMATFVLWQNMYQQAYYEYLYTQYGIYEDTNEILKGYASAADYGIAVASYYTTSALRTSLTSVEDYLLELVAGADEAVKNGLKLEAHDKAEVKEVVTWMQSVYASSQYASYSTFKNFLNIAVGDTFQVSDIEDAARLLVMYTKYSDYKSMALEGVATNDQLQDYILKNPSGHFEAKYYAFNGASEDMIREFFAGDFMRENAKTAYAKYLASVDKKALEELSGDELTAKLTELGITAKEYTKTEKDGETTYTPELIDEIAAIAFVTSNKQNSFRIVGGEDCAYLVYFAKTATTTKANIGWKEYTGTLPADVEALLTDSIKTGENTSEHKSAEDLATELMIVLDADKNAMPADAIETVIKNTTLTANKTYENTAPDEIVEVLYAKDAKVTEGMIRQLNNAGVSYVYKVTAIEENTTNYTVSYVTFEDSEFCAILRVFEDEFASLLSSSTAAPTYSLTYEVFKTQVLKYVMDDNFQSLVLNKKAEADYEQIATYAGSTKQEDIDLLQSKLESLFGITATPYTNNTTTKESMDSALFDFIFNSKNLGKVSVIEGEDSVYLVYVFPKATDDAADTVKAGWKEYKYDDATIVSDTVKGYYDLILKDLATDDRKNTTDNKSADDLAKKFYDDIKANKVTMPADADKTTTNDPSDKNATNTAPDAILDILYEDNAEIKTGTYYQANANGTSYVFTVTKITTEDDKTKYDITYATFEDSEYYSYFRAIKTKLDNAFAVKPSTLSHPESSTKGTYQEWICAGEYKEAQGDKGPDRVFDRNKEDISFFAATDSSGKATGSYNIYLIDEPMKQVKKEDAVIYGGYLLFESEKEANKALKGLGDKTGFPLVDHFVALSATTTNDKGEQSQTAATVSSSIKKETISDENLKNWLFSADRKANDKTVLQAKEEGYYVAFFMSTEQTWLRTARDGWISAEVASHIDQLVKDGGYKLHEENMEKVEGLITTAETTTAPTK
ncbi:MAG: hypothetical protein IJW50_04565 [Clostridia bacterium]|nr:hypothetical protein [Clostridia bacterium]